jgi:hypothetical protein
VAREDVPVEVDAGTELSAATAADLRSAVADALRQGRTIHLQLGSVVSYDAVGMGLLWAYGAGSMPSAGTCRA